MSHPKGFALLVFAALAAACALQPATVDRPAPDVDRTLTLYSYIEEGDLVTFIVDQRATRERDQVPYFIPASRLQRSEPQVDLQSRSPWHEPRQPGHPPKTVLPATTRSTRNTVQQRADTAPLLPA